MGIRQHERILHLAPLFHSAQLNLFLISGVALGADASAPAQPGTPSANKKEKTPPRPTPPTRSPDAAGAPKFTRLDGNAGANPPVNAVGNFVIGPDYVPAPELKAVEGVPQGKVQQFTMSSKDSKFFNPGIAREVFGTVDPKNPKTLIVETHPIDYQRTITVYIPAQYVAGTAAPFIVTHDGPQLGRPNMDLPHVLDNLIAQKHVPVQIAIAVANGGGDAQGKIGRAHV